MPWLRNHHHALLIVAALAIGAMGGYLGAMQRPSEPVIPEALRELSLKASSAHGNESFVVASGPVDDNVDAIFCLDSTTGKLTGFVIHPRVQRIFAAFQANVLDDLPPEQGKKPAYAMTVGRTKHYSGYSNLRLADAVIYVADCNTGKVVVYGFPWNTSGGDPYDGTAEVFVRLDVARSREVKLRERESDNR